MPKTAPHPFLLASVEMTRRRRRSERKTLSQVGGNQPPLQLTTNLLSDRDLSSVILTHRIPEGQQMLHQWPKLMPFRSETVAKSEQEPAPYPTETEMDSQFLDPFRRKHHRAQIGLEHSSNEYEVLGWLKMGLWQVEKEPILAKYSTNLPDILLFLEKRGGGTIEQSSRYG